MTNVTDITDLIQQLETIMVGAADLSVAEFEQRIRRASRIKKQIRELTDPGLLAAKEKVAAAATAAIGKVKGWRHEFRETDHKGTDLDRVLDQLRIYPVAFDDMLIQVHINDTPGFEYPASVQLTIHRQFRSKEELPEIVILLSQAKGILSRLEEQLTML